MRVVHVGDYYFPELGYDITYLAREQRRLGHEVVVITSDVGAEGRVEAGFREEGGSPVHRLRSVRILGRLWLRQLARRLVECEPDVIHCHGVYSLTAVRVALVKPRIRARLIYDCHEAYFNTQVRTGFLRVIAYLLFARLGGSLIRRRADWWYAIGEDEREFLCRTLDLREQDAPIVRLGVDTELFSVDRTYRKQYRSALGVEANEVLCVHAGRIARRKEVHLAVQVIRELRAAGVPVRLLLVGDVEPRYLDEIRSPFIIYKARVGKRELARLFNAADIAIWPGDISIGAIEAMATGLPLVLPATTRNGKLIEGGAGVLFGRGDPRQLRDAVKLLLSDAKKRDEAAVCARANAERYSWKDICNQVLTVYSGWQN
jgi:glycosyltransferase involved in cell wall biosynthesis